jgi:hypothetical protein
MRFNLPQKSLNLQFNLPLSINTYGDHDRTKEHETKNPSNNHRHHMTIIFCAQLILEATLRLIGGDGIELPIDSCDCVEFVFLN